MNLLALVLEDDTESRQGLAAIASREGFEALSARSMERVRELLNEHDVDILILDVELPDGSGLDLVEELREHPDVDVVIVSSTDTLDEAVHAMHEGAVDVLGKPVDTNKLRKILAEARRKGTLRREIGELRGELKSLGRFGRLVGKSAALQGVYDLIASVAPTSATVLVTGETGTGKEVVAASIHELSRRAKKAFVPLNCGAIAPTLIESELFGHERGSFTGATKDRKGVFERADGGTLFLDEVTEMSAELQVRLLRVLETQQVSPIGADESISVDVRVIASTNRDPQEAIQAGELREDLFFRLNVFQIPVPPLRQRGSDTILLAHHFLEELNREAGTAKELTEGSLRKIRAYDWPGNVRELRNAVERAFIVAADEIEPRHFRLGSQETAAEGELDITVGMSIAEAERRLILATLEEVDGNRKSAAAMLGISPKTLYNRLTSYAETEPKAST